MSRVLVGCEFSGVVREAFRRRGFDAWSCDLLPAEDRSPFHYQEDLREVLYDARTGGVWDLMIAHPPCTYLAVSGARWFKDRKIEQLQALDFVWGLMLAPGIPRFAIENPIGVISTRIRKPDQIIQPWQHGHGEVKATCLWLKNLPKLVPTNVVEGRHARVHHEAPSPDRWKNRSRTLPGIAEAMAAQWSPLLKNGGSMTERKAPGQWEDEALEAQKAGDWKLAAECWDNAAGATLGHNRRNRYEDAADHARTKIASEQQIGGGA